MIIAIDFDKTWTEDPILWLEFYKSCLLRGHRIIIATARQERADNSDMDRYEIPSGVPVIFTNGNFKRQACLKAGWTVDIWIDDTPSMVDPGLIINPDREL